MCMEVSVLGFPRKRFAWGGGICAPIKTARREVAGTQQFIKDTTSPDGSVGRPRARNCPGATGVLGHGHGGLS